MSIRREDKELIHNLAVLGALLGACLGVWAVVHLSNQAHAENVRQIEYRQTHAALSKLGTPKGVPGELVVDEGLIRQMQDQIASEQPEAVDQKESFWLRMPRWGLWGICGVSGIAGATAGFATIWLTGWAGSAFVYYFIRSIYKLIRKVAPNSAAAKSFTEQQKPPEPGQMAIMRDDHRILPMVVKLLFLLMLVLGVLGAVVWHLAGI